MTNKENTNMTDSYQEPWCDQCCDYNDHAPYGSHQAEKNWEAGLEADAERRDAEMGEGLALALDVQEALDRSPVSGPTKYDVLTEIAGHYL
jgi:hypothetical protein